MPPINAVMMQYFHWDYPADGSLWNQVAGDARALADAGISALWLPPPTKAQSIDDVGYGAYDLWDLGEFDQKGGIRTKYGTRQQLDQAIAAAHQAGLQIYIDVVFNHKGGADDWERTPGTPVNRENRNIDIGPPREIGVWTVFNFPGRGGQYSSMQWRVRHFDSVDYDQLTGMAGTIYRLADKQFETPVSDEYGNFDFLLFSDLDMDVDEVTEELQAWGEWVVRTFNVDGFRFDAAKHIRFFFFNGWLDFVRGCFPERELFAVGEHFTGDPSTLNWFLDQTGRRMSLFDFPLYFNMRAASEGGGGYDMRNILNNTLVQRSPAQAVTFVDNHDTFREQTERTIQDWFKPLAYAIILLREQGDPCVFYGDYVQVQGRANFRGILDTLLAARRDYAYGTQRDYFDHQDVIGWTRLGDGDHPRALAVVMSDGPGGVKSMSVDRPNGRFRDVTGNVAETVTTDADGIGQFRCNGGSLSVWVQE
jgi:alpha-amylase